MAEEAKERGEEYSFDPEEVEKGEKKHFLFLLIMTIILVTVVLLKFSFLFINLFK